MTNACIDVQIRMRIYASEHPHMHIHVTGCLDYMFTVLFRFIDHYINSIHSVRSIEWSRYNM